MLADLDSKLVLGIFATILTIVAYFPYLKDILAQKSKPHIYTWLIWGITQGTAALVLLQGGGKFGSLSLLMGTFFVLLIFILSFHYGTKNITRSDSIALGLALLAIVVWWQLHNPLLALFMVTGIDVMGLIPTMRKSFQEPWTETLSFWVLMSVVFILTMLSNAEYNLLTMFYLAVITITNTFLVTLLIVRRKILSPEATE
jgi:hypothetical protein